LRTALCPGSFDPLHNGHIDIFETAARLYDRVVVATIRNPGKGEPLFTLDERKELIKEVARDVGADVIVKGLRDGTDFASEMQQAQMNKAISGIQTVFLPCGPESSFIAATLIRQIAMFGGADRLGSMVPENVAKRLAEKYARS
jgi:pantetheine-phosphate adenylyltransferase